MYHGGAERYLVELARVIRAMGHEVDVYQSAQGTWSREHGDLRVKGVDTGGDPFAVSEAVSRLGLPDPLLTIHHAFYLARPEEPGATIGISHGVYWDDVTYQADAALREEHLSRILAALAALQAVVSVDTNTINWVRTQDWRLAEKCVYIPNFVDLGAFRAEPREDDGELHVLYPRRLDARRGFWLVAEMLPALLRAHPSLRFRFVGQADAREADAVRDLAARFAPRVAWEVVPPDRMREAYAWADVVLIPTVSSEGTSLSCLEAQAGGRAVVATHVGGLPDLVLDGYNGLLVAPDSGSVAAAVERLARDAALRKRLGANASRTVERFALPNWQAQWRGLLRTFLPAGSGARTEGDAASAAPVSDTAATPGARLAVLEGALVERDAALLRLRRQNVEEQARGRAALAERDRHIAALEAEQAGARAYVAGLVQSVAALEAEVSRTHAHIAGLEADLAKTRAYVGEMEADLAKTRVHVADLEAEQAKAHLHVTELQRRAAEDIAWLQEETRIREEALQTIHRSRLWKIGERYRRLRGILGRLREPRRLAESAGRRFLPRRAKRILHRYWTPLPPPVASAAAAPGPPSLPSDQRERTLPMPLPAKHDVVCFSIIDWEFRWQRPQQVMSRFADQGHRVFFISTSRFLKGNGKPYEVRPLRENVWELQISAPHPIDVYSGELAPGVPEAVVDALRALRDDFHVTCAVSVVQVATWAEAALLARERLGWRVAYDCMDEWDNFPGMRKALLEREAALVRDADLLIVTAQKLWEKWSGHNANTVLARNGADFEHFQRPTAAGVLTGVSGPVVGYFGAIADWFDLALMERLARERPRYTFVLVGGVFDVPTERLKAMPNVRLEGQQPYALMPAYLRRFDACIIPFKVNPITEATDPVKFYEYVSQGKPVVATAMAELAPYRDYLYIARDHDDFLARVDAALAEDDPALRARRVALARANTWQARVEAIEGGIRKAHPKASVIVVSYFNLEFTRLCLESVLRNSVYPSCEVIVVDNGSTDGTPEYLREMEARHPETIRVILNEQNLGFARANNQGLQRAGGDRFVLLNNDTVVPNGWLPKLLRHLDRPENGLVVAVTNFSGNESRIEVPYGKDLEQMEEFAARYTREHEGQIFDIRVAAMYCVAFRRDVLDKVGPLDEMFGMGMFEDDDYSHRIRLAGYRVVCAEDAFVHHYGQASFKKLSAAEYQAVWDRNQSYYEKKWGVAWQAHTPRK